MGPDGPITFYKDDLEWSEYFSPPTYDNPEMIYSLMTGNYIDGYVDLLPKIVTDKIQNEFSNGTLCQILLEESHMIYEVVCEIYNYRNHMKIVNQPLFQKVYDLLMDIVETYYVLAFYNFPINVLQKEISRCQKEYNCIMVEIQEFKEALSQSM